MATLLKQCGFTNRMSADSNRGLEGLDVFFFLINWGMNKFTPKTCSGVINAESKPYFRHYKKGFTLIELLVVVLIIGILAAVAVPQYRVMVAKARLASHLPFMRQLQKAQGAYYLANGTFATQIEDLDIECQQYGANAQCYLDADGKVYARWAGYYFILSDSLAGRALLLFFNFSDSYSASCYAYDDFSKRVCQSLTGHPPDSVSAGTNVTTYRIF